MYVHFKIYFSKNCILIQQKSKTSFSKENPEVIKRLIDGITFVLNNGNNDKLIKKFKITKSYV
jgi:hypothetical protein